MPSNIYHDPVSGNTYDLNTMPPHDLIALRDELNDRQLDAYDKLTAISRKLSNTDPKTHSTEDLNQQEQLKKLFDSTIYAIHKVDNHRRARHISYKATKRQRQLDR